ncbi:unnamed protein product [Caenorhabditis bovis]|uniref:Transcription initiation factor TFIID subunit 6 n=1 Tax=Caenorhabditis bovis TaxID=2654633 RepID=A0A8S1EYW8_9PELO|nr:unnamed protein product [Caenorhabditis bovis]
MTSNGIQDNADNVAAIACDCIGISKIEKDARVLVQNISKEFLKETIRLAQKWARHSGRRKMIVDDLIYALVAMQGTEVAKKIVPLIDTDSLGLETLTCVHANNVLFVRPNSEVDLDPSTSTSQVVPIESRLKSYFMVTDGQPTKSAYNLNLSEEEIDDEDDDEDSEDFAVGTNEKSNEFKSSRVLKRPVSSTEMFLQAAKVAKTEQIVGLKPHSVEMLTIEQQMFIKDILTACMGTEDKRRHEALATLEHDAGIQINVNMAQRCLSLIIYANRLLRGIVLNKAAELGPFLHDIIPALMSSMLGRNMCIRLEDNHWALRDYSWKTFLSLYRDHIEPNYAKEFRKRTFKLAWDVFSDDHSSAPMIYGTIGLLTEFVPEEKMEWLLDEFDKMIKRLRLIQVEMSQRGNTWTNEQNKLYSTLTRHEAVLRTRLNLLRK